MGGDGGILGRGVGDMETKGKDKTKGHTYKGKGR